MKKGVFTCGTPEYDIYELSGVLRELGYDGVELRIAEPLPDKKPENYTYENRYWTYNKSTLNVHSVEYEVLNAAKVFQKENIEICGLTTYLKFWETDDIRKVLKSADAINCRNIRVFEPFYDGRENYRVLFDKALQQVKVLEAMAKEYNVRINFEIHMNTILPSSSAAYRLVSHFDPKYIGIIFDPGNMVHEGFENYSMGIELLGEYLAHVHVKNAIWKKSETTSNGIDLWKAEWAPLKEGYADLGSFIRLLDEKGYKGYLSLEDFTNQMDTHTKLANYIDFVNMVEKQV